MTKTPGGGARGHNVATQDQRRAAEAQTAQLAELMASLSGVELVHGRRGDPNSPAASNRVLEDWIESLTSEGPKGVCRHISEMDGPMPCGGFPFMPATLLCWRCLIEVTGAIAANAPGMPPIPCPGCGDEAPLSWGTTTVGMYTLLLGLCRACHPEHGFSEAPS